MILRPSSSQFSLATRLDLPAAARLAMAALVLPFAVSAAHATENCFVSSGAKFKRDPLLYYAMAKVESGLRQVVNTSHIERTGTVDICAMQINSGNLKTLEKRGITKERLLDEPCLCVDVGAEILEEKIAKYGNTWEAVGAYNAACTQLKGEDCDRARQTYVNKVAKEYYRVIEARRAEVKGQEPVMGSKKRPALRVTVAGEDHLAAQDN